MVKSSTYPFLFITILFFAFQIPSFGQNAAPDSSVIEVFAENAAAGKIKLIGVFGDQNFIMDSSVIDAAGHFALRRKKPLPAGFYYFLLANGKNYSLLLDKTEQFFTLKMNMNDIANTMQVTGCLNTDLLYQNFRFQGAQEAELNQLAATLKKFAPGAPEYTAAKARQDVLVAERKKHLDDIYKKYPTSLFAKFKQAGQNPDFVEFKKPNGDIDTIRQVVYFRDHFWDGVDFSDDRLIRTPVISNKLKRYIKELTPQRPDSIIAVSDALIRKVMPYKPYFQLFTNWIALQYENTKTTVMDGEAAYVHVINNFFTPELAFWDTPENIEKLRKHAWEMEASLLGKVGQDVVANNQFGNPKSLYDIKAPVMVIFMFSPDCEHCQKEADNIEAIYEKWKPKGVEFFGIGVNTNQKDWKEFIEKHKFSFTNVYDPTNRSIYAKYYVDITPELYVLDKDHYIVAKNLHPEQLEAIFERELRKAN